MVLLWYVHAPELSMTLLIGDQIWCWIPSKWDFLRLATLYGIVW